MQRLIAESILKRAEIAGVQLCLAKKQSDQCLVGIHLQQPTLDEVEAALDRAIRDLFPRVVIHSRFTWPRRRDK
jgi:hypothetical protein